MTPRWFEPPLAGAAAPAVMPSPFAEEPHPLARRAADELRRELAADPRPLDSGGGGKMFGVLVVRGPDGRLGYLRAFSGMLRGAWWHDGFAPPLFDGDERAQFWPAGEAELATLTATCAQLDARARSAAAEVAALDARHAAERAALEAELAARKAARHVARAAGAAADALDDASRADGRRRRTLVAAQRERKAERVAAAARADAELAIAQDVRAQRSRELYARLHAGYVVVDARGHRHELAALYPGPPPGGAGDCAAPKLLAAAYRAGLTPVALAEFWWGPPEAGRLPGRFYPACRGKCGPLLPAMLTGLAVDDAPVFGDAPPADAPRIVHVDDHVIVVDKPVGLLSVPGRSGRLHDAVVTRLRARFDGLDGPIVVHRLDLDTSGLLLCARDAATAAALATAFARREIGKRYVAVLDGEVADDAGVIALPLGPDLDDRPRQRVDPRHGKPAHTGYRVLARGPGRTRVEFTPHTGRTHQLRVHAAVGLGAPIVGDRLYGRVAGPRERLHLHATGLTFTHPRTGARLELTSPPPF